MKKSMFLLLLALTASLTLLSQSTNKQSEVAELLFKDVKTTLTIPEKNRVATALGFIPSGNKDQPFALDKDSKEFPFTATVLPTDLNKDGKEEIFVSFGNGYTSGNTGSSISLFIKDAKGVYQQHLGFPGMVPDALASASQGYPDLLIGGPGFEYPVWRWNGKTYNLHRQVKDQDYEKLKKTGIEELSKAYQQNLHSHDH